MTVTPFNFLKPGPVASGLEPHVAGWWRRACTLARQNWTSALPFPLEVHYDSAELVPAGEALANLSAQAVGYPVVCQQTVTTVLCWPRPVTLGLVLALLGEAPAQLPAD